MGRFVKVAEDGDVRPGKVKAVRLADRKVALFNENGAILAYEDYCTHTGGPLTQGSCADGVVTCLWHGAQWTFIAWGGIHAIFLIIERCRNVTRFLHNRKAT